MKLKFRKAFSLLCAVCMLLTSIPFLVISEESVVGNDMSQDLAEQVPQMTEIAPNDEAAETPASEEAPAAVEPEQVVAEPENTVQDEIPSEPETPVQEQESQEYTPAEDQSGEGTNHSDLSQEDTGRIPDFEPEEPAGIIMEFEQEEAQAIEQVELAVTTQAVDEQNIPETQQEAQEIETQEVPETQQEETAETTTENDAQQNQEEEAEENRVNEAEQASEETGTEQPQENQQSETSGAEQGNDPQQAHEDENNESSETIQEQNDEETTITPENDDVTILDEIWADYVTNVNADDPDVTVWSVNGDLEAGKETVIRIISSAETNLYFLLTAGSELEAALTDENNENRTLFDVDENEADTGLQEYSLRAVHFEEGGSRSIHIVPAANSAFELQVLTAAAWGAQQETTEPAAEENEQETVETPEANAEEAADDQAGESTDEEVIPEEVPVFETEDETLVRYNGDEENVIVPDGIKEIGSRAFYGNEAIKTITLPDSVELINNAAFADCINLEQVIVSGQSQLVTIGNGAFRNDIKLDISFADDVPNVVSNAFEGISEDAEEEAEAENEEEKEDEEAEETAASEETEVNEETEETVDYQLVFEGEDFTVTVTFTEEAQLPEGTELTVQELLPETEEYEAYFSLTDEERGAIWNAVAEEGRLFLIAFLYNEEEIAPQAAIDVQITLAEPELQLAESPMVFEGEGFTATVTFTEEALLPLGTELTVREILPETEEYEAYFSLTEEERSAIWNVVAEEERLFLIAFLYNEEEIIPQSSIDVKIELAEPEIVFLEAGQMIFEGEDFTVTVNFGDDALFPEGTELSVREILPDTPEYALYSGMTDEALNEDWSEITLERYFDIAFMANEEEIEPKGFVDVQITFHEKIEQNEETEVQAVHFENNEANVIEVETDSTKVAVQDEEAIDTVSFSSDSFSVYGVVQKKKIITKTLVAGGNTYEIEVTYTQEAEIPENAEVVVEEIPEGSDLWEAYRKQTAAALNADDVRLPGLYDISIVDEEGNKIEPKAPVNVAIRLANAENTEEELHVVHFTEEMPQEFVDTIAQAAAESQQPEEQNTEKISDQANDQTREQTEVQIDNLIEPIAEEEKIASEKIEANVEGDTVTFDTEGFSVYAFAYTVVVYYKVASGETYKIIINYDENSGIPAGSMLQVTEILPEDERYNDYLNEANEAALHAETLENDDAVTAENLEEAGETPEADTSEENSETTVSDNQYARFFDIEIQNNGQKIEPIGKVAVTIMLADAPEGEELKVVHFADEGTEIIETQNSSENIQFETESFSVYAVITIPSASTDVEDLAGKSFLIRRKNGQYMTSQVHYDNGNGPQQIGKTSDASQATVWTFEDAGQPGQYYISATGQTDLQAGHKVYLHMESRNNNSSANVRVYEEEGSDDAWVRPKMAFTVTQDNNGYYIYASLDRNYYLNEWGSNPELGFAGYQYGPNNTNSTLILESTGIRIDDGKYVLVSGIENDLGIWNQTWNYSETTTSDDEYTKVVNAHAVTSDIHVWDNSHNSLTSVGVHVWEDNNERFVGGIATEWTISWNATQGGYNISTEGQYIRFYDNYGLELTSDVNSATAFEFMPTDNSRVLIKAKGENRYMHDSGSIGNGEWQSRYYTMWYWDDGSSPEKDFKFWLAKKSDYVPYVASKIASTELNSSSNLYIIYYRGVDSEGKEKLYAIRNDGSMIPVYDGGNAVYWHEKADDQSLYWYYQESDGNYFISATDSTVYLDPTSSNLIVHNNPDDPNQALALTMLGKENGAYGSTIEKWNGAFFDYTGIHVDPDTGAMSIGTRASGDSNDFYFALADSYAEVTTKPVATVDSDALGIKITMFDYGDPNSYTAGDHLQAMTDIVGGDAYRPHEVSHLVKPYLSGLNGVPINNSGNAMTGLFGDSKSDAMNEAPRKNVTDLFLQSYYSADGTFRYRSEDNYAYLAPGETSFTVYGQAATPFTKDLAVGHAYYYHGHFMPYNPIDMDNNLARLIAQSGLDPLDEEDGRAYEPIYGIDGTPNYYTGMKMEADFVQPRDGTLENGNDMIFKFTGDDDMWVYIDGVLVLDIGGIHEPLSGSINFRTGVVTKPDGSTSTLEAIMTAAISDLDDNNPIKKKVQSIEWENGTFSDYSTHTFAAFYMERGAGASNLDLQFNLKVVRKGAFVVEKEIPDGIDPRFTREYTFRATYQDDDNNEQPLYKGTGYCTAVFLEGTGKELPVDNNGCFKLKAGEKARFEMSQENVPYRIQEIGINPDEISDVKINGAAATIQYDEALGYYVDTGLTDVYKRNMVTITNEPVRQELKITKHLLFGTYSEEENEPTFNFRVYLESEERETDQDGNYTGNFVKKLIPYGDANGQSAPYYLVKEINGEIHYFTLTGTNNAPEDRGTERKDSLRIFAGRNGSIDKVPPEYTVIIPNLTAGTNFYIEEYFKSEDQNKPIKYEFKREELTSGTYASSTMISDINDISNVLMRSDGTSNPLDSHLYGMIVKEQDADAHVYNGKLTEFTVAKNWETGNESIHDATINVQIRRYLLKTNDPVDPSVPLCFITIRPGEGNGAPYTVKVNKGSAYTLPDCPDSFTAPTGKMFSAWDAGNIGDTITVTGNMTIDAQWVDQPATVCQLTFVPGAGNGNPYIIEVNKWSSYQLPACPTAFTGPTSTAVFNGWDAGEVGTEITVTGNMTIEAQWYDPSKFTVTINVGYIPQGTSLHLFLQQIGNGYPMIQDQNNISANSSVTFETNDPDGRYQLQIQQNSNGGNWGNGVFNAISDTNATVNQGSYGGTTYYNVNENSGLKNGATYTINWVDVQQQTEKKTVNVSGIHWKKMPEFTDSNAPNNSVTITVTLMHSGHVWGTKTLSSSENWACSFTNLPEELSIYDYYWQFSYSSPVSSVYVDSDTVTYDNNTCSLYLIAQYDGHESSVQHQKEQKAGVLEHILNWIFPSAYADGTPQAQITANYRSQVEQTLDVSQDSDWEYDSNWTYTVTLDKNDANWTEAVKELETTDEYGNVYVYFIESIEESGLPGDANDWSADWDQLIFTPDNPGDAVLTLTNRLYGHITVVKQVEGIVSSESIPVDNEFMFDVKNGNDTVDTLAVTTSTSDTTINLELDKTYTITEVGTSVPKIPGYDFTGVTFSQNPSSTGANDPSSINILLNSNQTVTVYAVNHYVPKYVYDEIPADVTFKKVDNAQALNLLAGAEFKLYGDPGLNNVLETFIGSQFKISTDSTSMGDNVYVPTFPAVPGNANSTSITLYLKETKAPDYRQLIDHTYVIVITKTVTGPTLVQTRDAFVTTTEYSITVDEKPVISNTNGQTVVTDINIENPFEPTTLTVDKTWFQNNTQLTGNAYLPDASITVHLERSLDGNIWSSATDFEGVILSDYEVTLTKNDNWSKTWTNLPKYAYANASTDDLSVIQIQYRVVETTAKLNSKEALAVNSQAVVFDQNGRATLRNDLPTKDITVKKTWNKSSSWPDSHIEVGMTLLVDNSESLSLPTYMEGETTVSQSAQIWLTANEASTGYTWHNLPVYAENGDKFTYTVAETGMRYRMEGSNNPIEIADWKNAFDITPLNGIGTPDAENPVVIDNTPKTTEIQVTKIWTLNHVARTNKQEISYKLYQIGSDSALNLNSYTLSADHGEATINKVLYATDSGWQTITISGLPKYEISIDTTANPAKAVYVPVDYYVAEDVGDDMTYTTITYSKTESEQASTEGAALEAATNDGLITIYNRDTDLILKVLKVDNTATETKLLEGAEFQLQKMKADGTAEYAPYTRDLFADSRYPAEGAAILTITDKVEGINFEMLTDGNYKLVETKAPDGYVMAETPELKFTVTDGVIVTEIAKNGFVVDYKPVNESNNTPTVTIGNTPGVELPATGGPGTLGYTIAGLVLILLAAGGWLAGSKRRAVREHK